MAQQAQDAAPGLTLGRPQDMKGPCCPTPDPGPLIPQAGTRDPEPRVSTTGLVSVLPKSRRPWALPPRRVPWDSTFVCSTIYGSTQCLAVALGARSWGSTQQVARRGLHGGKPQKGHLYQNV